MVTPLIVVILYRLLSAVQTGLPVVVILRRIARRDRLGGPGSRRP